ncbi:hypothetical protein ABPG72_004547 [Tetrahymena utriculariae]
MKDDLQIQNQELKKKNEDLQSQINQNKYIFYQFNSQKEDILNENQQLKKKIDLKDLLCQNIGIQYQELNVQYQEIKEKHQQLENKYQELVENSVQKKKIKDLQCQLTSNQKINNEQIQIIVLQKANQQLKKQIASKDQQYQNIDLQNKELNAQCLEIKQNFQQLSNSEYVENNILKNKIEGLQFQITQNMNSFNSQNEVHLNEIQQLEQKIVQQEELKLNIEGKYKDLNLLYHETNQKYQQLQNKYQELQENNKQLSYNDEQQQNLIKQKKDLDIQCQESNEKLLMLQNKYQEIEKQKFEQQQQIKKLKTQNTKLKKQNIEYAEKLKQKQEEQNLTNNESVINQKYDLEIKIQSILDLENKQEYSSQIVENMNIKNTNQKIITAIQNSPNSFDQYCNVIGFLGERNKGKTFILNSLICEQSLNAFNNYRSQGISIKYQNNNGRNVIFIDHKGFNQPAFIDYDINTNYINYIEKKEKGQDYFKDVQNFQNEIILNAKFQKITELIQQGFIIQYSQILILVVSKINQEQQNYIYSISNSFGQDASQRHKKIFVVHNLKHIINPECVEKYIQEIKNIFPLRQQQVCYSKQPLYKQNFIFIDKINNNVNHLFIAKEKSLAGEEYNRFVIDYLREEIAHCKQQTKFDVIKQFKDYLNQNIQSYLTLTCQKQSQDLKTKDFVEYDQQKQIIQLKKEFHIEKLKCLQINFGILQNQCQYSIVSNKQNNKLYLLVQIPSSARFNYTFVKSKGIFEIKIVQNHEIEQQLGTSYISNRKLEEEYQIQICKEEELYHLIKDEQKDFQNGLHQFVFIQEFDKEDQ